MRMEKEMEKISWLEPLAGWWLKRDNNTDITKSSHEK